MLDGVASAVLARLLSGFIKPFVSNWDSSRLSMSVSTGEIIIRDLRLCKTALDCLGFPFEIDIGVIELIRIVIPVVNISVSPVQVEVNGVYISISPCHWSAAKCVDHKQWLKLLKLWFFEQGKERLKQIAKYLYIPGFIERLSYRVLHNLELVLTNIHLCCEAKALTDNEKNSGITSEDWSLRPFVCGVIVKELSVHTANANWKKAFAAGDNDDQYFKLARVCDFSMYWVSGAHEMRCRTSVKIDEKTFNDRLMEIKLLEPLVGSVRPSEHGGVRTLDYIMRPTNLDVKIIQESYPTDVKPRIKLSIRSEERLISTISKSQYLDLLYILEFCAYTARRYRYCDFKPRVPVKGNTHAWWAFAIEGVRRTLNNDSDRFTPLFISNRRNVRLKYIDLFKRYKQAKWLPPLSSQDVSDMEEIERDLDFSTVTFFRSIANLEFNMELNKYTEQIKSKGGGGWLSIGSWVGWTSNLLVGSSRSSVSDVHDDGLSRVNTGLGFFNSWFGTTVNSSVSDLALTSDERKALAHVFQFNFDNTTGLFIPNEITNAGVAMLVLDVSLSEISFLIVGDSSDAAAHFVITPKPSNKHNRVRTKSINMTDFLPSVPEIEEIMSEETNAAEEHEASSSHARVLISISLHGFMIQASVRPPETSISLSLSAIEIFDPLCDDPEYSYIVGQDGAGLVDQNQRSLDTVAYKIDVFARISDDNGGESISVKLIYDSPVITQVVFNPLTLRRLFHFVSSLGSIRLDLLQFEVARQIRSVTGIAYGAFGLFTRLTKSFIQMHLELCIKCRAPIFILPSAFDLEDGPTLVADLGFIGMDLISKPKYPNCEGYAIGIRGVSIMVPRTRHQYRNLILEMVNNNRHSQPIVHDISRECSIMSFCDVDVSCYRSLVAGSFLTPLVRIDGSVLNLVDVMISSTVARDIFTVIDLLSHVNDSILEGAEKSALASFLEFSRDPSGEFVPTLNRSSSIFGLASFAHERYEPLEVKLKSSNDADLNSLTTNNDDIFGKFVAFPPTQELLRMEFSISHGLSLLAKEISKDRDVEPINIMRIKIEDIQMAGLIRRHDVDIQVSIAGLYFVDERQPCTSDFAYVLYIPTNSLKTSNLLKMGLKFWNPESPLIVEQCSPNPASADHTKSVMEVSLVMEKLDISFHRHTLGRFLSVLFGMDPRPHMEGCYSNITVNRVFSGRSRSSSAALTATRMGKALLSYTTRRMSETGNLPTLDSAVQALSKDINEKQPESLVPGAVVRHISAIALVAVTSISGAATVFLRLTMAHGTVYLDEDATVCSRLVSMSIYNYVNLMIFSFEDRNLVKSLVESKLTSCNMIDLISKSTKYKEIITIDSSPNSGISFSYDKNHLDGGDFTAVMNISSNSLRMVYLPSALRPIIAYLSDMSNIMFPDVPEDMPALLIYIRRYMTALADFVIEGVVGKIGSMLGVSMIDDGTTERQRSSSATSSSDSPLSTDSTVKKGRIKMNLVNRNLLLLAPKSAEDMQRIELEIGEVSVSSIGSIHDSIVANIVCTDGLSITLRDMEIRTFLNRFGSEFGDALLSDFDMDLSVVRLVVPPGLSPQSRVWDYKHNPIGPSCSDVTSDRMSDVVCQGIPSIISISLNIYAGESWSPRLYFADDYIDEVKQLIESSDMKQAELTRLAESSFSSIFYSKASITEYFKRLHNDIKDLFPQVSLNLNIDRFSIFLRSQRTSFQLDLSITQARIHGHFYSNHKSHVSVKLQDLSIRHDEDKRVDALFVDVIQKVYVPTWIGAASTALKSEWMISISFDMDPATLRQSMRMSLGGFKLLAAMVVMMKIGDIAALQGITLPDPRYIFESYNSSSGGGGGGGGAFDNSLKRSHHLDVPLVESFADQDHSSRPYFTEFSVNIYDAEIWIPENVYSGDSSIFGVRFELLSFFLIKEADTFSSSFSVDRVKLGLRYSCDDRIRVVPLLPIPFHFGGPIHAEWNPYDLNWDITCRLAFSANPGSNWEIKTEGFELESGVIDCESEESEDEDTTWEVANQDMGDFSRVGSVIHGTAPFKANKSSDASANSGALIDFVFSNARLQTILKIALSIVSIINEHSRGGKENAKEKNDNPGSTVQLSKGQLAYREVIMNIIIQILKTSRICADIVVDEIRVTYLSDLQFVRNALRSHVGPLIVELEHQADCSQVCLNCPIEVRFAHQMVWQADVLEPTVFSVKAAARTGKGYTIEITNTGTMVVNLDHKLLVTILPIFNITDFFYSLKDQLRVPKSHDPYAIFVKNTLPWPILLAPCTQQWMSYTHDRSSGGDDLAVDSSCIILPSASARIPWIDGFRIALLDPTKRDGVDENLRLSDVYNRWSGWSSDIRYENVLDNYSRGLDYPRQVVWIPPDALAEDPPLIPFAIAESLINKDESNDDINDENDGEYRSSRDRTRFLRGSPQPIPINYDAYFAPSSDMHMADLITYIIYAPHIVANLCKHDLQISWTACPWKDCLLLSRPSSAAVVVQKPSRRQSLFSRQKVVEYKTGLMRYSLRIPGGSAMPSIMPFIDSQDDKFSLNVSVETDTSLLTSNGKIFVNRANTNGDLSFECQEFTDNLLSSINLVYSATHGPGVAAGRSMLLRIRPKFLIRLIKGGLSEYTAGMLDDFIDDSIELCQHNCDKVVSVKDASQLDFDWFNSIIDPKRIQVRPDASWEWSLPFAIDVVDTFAIKCRRQRDEKCDVAMMRIHVSSWFSSFEICISDAEFPPVLINNETWMTLNFREKGYTGSVDTVGPSSSIGYVRDCLYCQCGANPTLTLLNDTHTCLVLQFWYIDMDGVEHTMHLNVFQDSIVRSFGDMRKPQDPTVGVLVRVLQKGLSIEVAFLEFPVDPIEGSAFYVYENERKAFGGWSSRNLGPTERRSFSNDTGSSLQFENATLPPDEQGYMWVWDTDVFVVDLRGDVDMNGWMYAFNWPSMGVNILGGIKWHPHQHQTSFVRRRRWVRFCRRVPLCIMAKDVQLHAEWTRTILKVSIVFDSLLMYLTDHTASDLLQVKLNGIDLNFTERAKTRFLKLRLDNLAIINCLDPTPAPFLLRKDHRRAGVRPFFDLHIIQVKPETAMFSLNPNARHGFEYARLRVVHLRRFAIRMHSFYVNLEDEILARLVRWYQAAGAQAVVNSPLDVQRTDGLAWLWNMRFHFESFYIMPLCFYVSFTKTHEGLRLYDGSVGAVLNSFGFIAANIQECGLSLSSLMRIAISGGVLTFMNIIYHHYFSQISGQFYKLVGSSAILGNPTRIAQSLFQTGADVFFDPSDGELRTPSSLAKGLPKNVTAFGLVAASGLAFAFGGVMSTGSRLFAKLTFDSKYALDVGGVKTAQAGVGMFGKSLLSAVAGLVLHPYRGARENGVGGFFIGIGKGVVGLGLKPVAGAFSLVGGTLLAIGDGMDDFRVERPLRHVRSLTQLTADNAMASEQSDLILPIVDIKIVLGNEEIPVGYRVVLETSYGFDQGNERNVPIPANLNAGMEFHGGIPVFIAYKHGAYNDVAIADVLIHVVDVSGTRPAHPIPSGYELIEYSVDGKLANLNAGVSINACTFAVQLLVKKGFGNVITDLRIMRGSSNKPMRSEQAMLPAFKPILHPTDSSLAGSLSCGYLYYPGGKRTGFPWLAIRKESFEERSLPISGVFVFHAEVDTPSDYLVIPDPTNSLGGGNDAVRIVVQSSIAKEGVVADIVVVDTANGETVPNGYHRVRRRIAGAGLHLAVKFGHLDAPFVTNLRIVPAKTGPPEGFSALLHTVGGREVDISESIQLAKHTKTIKKDPVDGSAYVCPRRRKTIAGSTLETTARARLSKLRLTDDNQLSGFFASIADSFSSSPTPTFDTFNFTFPDRMSSDRLSSDFGLTPRPGLTPLPRYAVSETTSRSSEIPSSHVSIDSSIPSSSLKRALVPLPRRSPSDVTPLPTPLSTPLPTPLPSPRRQKPLLCLRKAEWHNQSRNSEFIRPITGIVVFFGDVTVGNNSMPDGMPAGFSYVIADPLNPKLFLDTNKGSSSIHTSQKIHIAFKKGNPGDRCVMDVGVIFVSLKRRAKLGMLTSPQVLAPGPDWVVVDKSVEGHPANLSMGGESKYEVYICYQLGTGTLPVMDLIVTIGRELVAPAGYQCIACTFSPFTLGKGKRKNLYANLNACVPGGIPMFFAIQKYPFFFTATPARLRTFRYPITDMAIFFVDKNEYSEQAIAEGWELISYTPSHHVADLNGVTGEGRSIYIGVRRDVAALPITDIDIVIGAVIPNVNEAPINFEIVYRTYGGQLANLSSGARARECYLCYRRGSGRPISEIAVLRRYIDRVPPGYRWLATTSNDINADVNQRGVSGPIHLAYLKWCSMRDYALPKVENTLSLSRPSPPCLDGRASSNSRDASPLPVAMEGVTLDGMDDRGVLDPLPGDVSEGSRPLTPPEEPTAAPPILVTGKYPTIPRLPSVTGISLPPHRHSDGAAARDRASSRTSDAFPLPNSQGKGDNEGGSGTSVSPSRGRETAYVTPPRNRGVSNFTLPPRRSDSYRVLMAASEMSSNFVEDDEPMDSSVRYSLPSWAEDGPPSTEPAERNRRQSVEVVSGQHVVHVQRGASLSPDRASP